MGKTTTKIFDLDGKPVGKARVPAVFKTPLRPDVIKRAVVSMQSRRFQPQGRDPLAGKRRSFESLGAGHGISRFPRLKSGGQRAVFAVGVVSGRAANPPVSQKDPVKNLPRKEMRFAVRSALAATGSKEIVESRGHIVEDVGDFPLVVTDDIQNLKKTSEVEEAFIKIGVWPDIYRVSESVKERAGKGKGRGRRIKHAIGPLLVVSDAQSVAKAARNLPGVDVCQVRNLNAEVLAPGTHPGRLTVWTQSAFEKLGETFGKE